jgi:hypothetical protein
LLNVAVLVLGAKQSFAFALKSRRVRRLCSGVRVRVQSQNPCLGQQRPREAEQQQQGYVGTQGLHSAKIQGKPRKRQMNKNSAEFLINPIQVGTSYVLA